ncbi:MAG: glycoside hydrolase family 127 protein, partial [Bacteroidaceae bacterium]|nr:glycoside hydrolase family 127 protein [Bacteroidaceae bacterium]
MKKLSVIILAALTLSSPAYPAKKVRQTARKAAAAATTMSRTISKVEAVSVQCPEGTVPRLPALLWVTYTNGKGEYRQVLWNNYDLPTEQAEADTRQMPAGTGYTVSGYIVGDDSTPRGYAVSAEVSVCKGTYSTPAAKPVAQTLPLCDVSITGDNQLTHNRDLDIRTILSWDVSQQLYNYRDTYGLPTDGYKEADGWDSPTIKLKGHGTGHYLSALAFAYASATDAKQKEQLYSNISRMVKEMRQCQERTFVWSDSLGRYFEARDLAPEQELREMKGGWADFDKYKKDYKHYGYGYLNAIPAQHPVLVEMYRAYNNEHWLWAPYYTIHKQLAGLIDIATYVHRDGIDKLALQIAKDMGLWVWNRLHYRTYISREGTQEERRSRPGNRFEMWNMYIAGENGGMGESMARLSEMVSDPTDKARLIEGASFFDNPTFFDALSRNIDDIRTRHANQHIPQIVGALRSYMGNGNPYYYNLSLNFWQMIQGRYRYCTGGVGNGEMFRQPYTQTLSMVTNGVNANEKTANPTLNETCCAYNLAKLSKDLACYNPDNAALMDYYERLLYNQIVGSVNPDNYGVTYQYAIGLNASKPFGSETPQSTCCGGTGSENHVKYQEAAYLVSDNTLWVSLYMPTKVSWQQMGVEFEQQCSWPADKSTIVVTKGGGCYAVKLRVPYWATDGFTVKLNGKTLTKDAKPSTYYEIPARQWNAGDKITVDMPFTLHLDYAPDKLNSALVGSGDALESAWLGTLMYGPLAMTATGITTWKDATLNLKASRHPVNPSGVVTLNYDGREFLPDYYRHDNSTHYLRLLNVPKSKSATGSAVAEIDDTSLKSAIYLAEQRVAEQQRWNEAKRQQSAPWAPNGYARLTSQLDNARTALKAKSSQADIDQAAVGLNSVLMSMRPGNLAEPEDLATLEQLLTTASRQTSTADLKDAVDYGRMVIRYVKDGSGT